MEVYVADTLRLPSVRLKKKTRRLVRLRMSLL